jgi:hypothetical protein
MIGVVMARPRRLGFAVSAPRSVADRTRQRERPLDTTEPTVRRIPRQYKLGSRGSVTSCEILDLEFEAEQERYSGRVIGRRAHPGRLPCAARWISRQSAVGTAARARR